jgi:hypothetical protein
MLYIFWLEHRPLKVATVEEGAPPVVPVVPTTVLVVVEVLSFFLQEKIITTVSRIRRERCFIKQMYKIRGITFRVLLQIIATGRYSM